MAATLIFLVIGLPWLGTLAVWLAGNSREKLLHGLAVAFGFATAAVSLVLLAFPSAEAVVRLPLGSVLGVLTFVPDGLGLTLTAVAALVGSLAVLFSVDYMRGDPQLSRYYALVLLFIGAMIGLVLSGNLLFTFFFWEITALCSYALISFYNDDPKAVAGGIKALIVTQVGGIGLLAGALVTYANFGTYQISDLLAAAHTLPPVTLAWIAFGFLLAAAAKSAQFPFHTWLPDAMEAPTPVSALIHAATMVNAGVYLLARFYPAFYAVPGWRLAVTLVGVLSALLAALMALTATDLKRVLAYSTISQLGYMVYAIGVGGVFASQFHLLSHAVFKALLFLAAGAVIHSVGTRDMRRMGGLGARLPLVRNVFVIGALALAGIPIFNGFWSKELILESGLQGGATWAYVAMLIGAGLTALYSVRMVWMVFYGAPREKLPVHEVGIFMRIATIALAAGTCLTWLLAGPLAGLFARSLPYHAIEAMSTYGLLAEVVTAPATWLALVVVAVGLALFGVRNRLVGLVKSAGWFDALGESGFGAEWLNRQVASGVQAAAGVLQKTQTGELNWNILGIVGALLVVLALLAWSG